MSPTPRPNRCRSTPSEFEAHLAALQAFQTRLLNTLQRSGQTAFYVAYEDLQDVAVMNGLVPLAGRRQPHHRAEQEAEKAEPRPDGRQGRQFRIRWNGRWPGWTGSTCRARPNFEPRRGPLIPTYVAAAESPLLYHAAEIRAEPRGAGLAGGAGSGDAGPLQTGFSQKTLRDWLREHPGHRTFTVVRHPVVWAHTAFCDRIVGQRTRQLCRNPRHAAQGPRCRGAGRRRRARNRRGLRHEGASHRVPRLPEVPAQQPVRADGRPHRCRLGLAAFAAAGDGRFRSGRRHRARNVAARAIWRGWPARSAAPPCHPCQR